MLKPEVVALPSGFCTEGRESEILFVSSEVVREEDGSGRVDEEVEMAWAWRRQNELSLRSFPLNLVGAGGTFDFVARVNILRGVDSMHEVAEGSQGEMATVREASEDNGHQSLDRPHRHPFCVLRKARVKAPESVRDTRVMDIAVKH